MERGRMEYVGNMGLVPTLLQNGEHFYNTGLVCIRWLTNTFDAVFSLPEELSRNARYSRVC